MAKLFHFFYGKRMARCVNVRIFAGRIIHTPRPMDDMKKTADAPTQGPADSRKKTGNRGEDLAADYLQRHGHHIHCRQWRHGHLELDLISSDLSTSELVFVEVKTRRSDEYGDPLDAVDGRKIRRICSAAHFYLTSNAITADYRFDIVTVLLPDGGEPVVTHYRDAFYPPLQR